MATMLEVGWQMIRGERELFPVARLIGADDEGPRTGACSVRAARRGEAPQPAGHAARRRLLRPGRRGDGLGLRRHAWRKGESFTTIELKINFLRAVRDATLTAEAKVVKAGSTLGYVECEVKDDQGRLVAKAASTCMKLKRE